MWRQNCHCFAPRFEAASRHSRLQAVDRRRDDEDHQRQLEVDVRELDSALGEQLEVRPADARVVARVSEPGRHDAERAEGRDERERERDAAEVRRDTRERRQHGADPPRRAVTDRRIGNEQADDAAERGGDEADPEAAPVRVDVRVLEEQVGCSRTSRGCPCPGMRRPSPTPPGRTGTRSRTQRTAGSRPMPATGVSGRTRGPAGVPAMQLRSRCLTRRPASASSSRSGPSQRTCWPMLANFTLL